MNARKCFAVASAALVSAYAVYADFVPEGLPAVTEVFFPFTGYANGTSWVCPDATEYASKSSTAWLNQMSAYYKNSANPGSDANRCIKALTAGNGYVTVTNETPGKYLFSSANAKSPMVSDYMSIRPVTDGSRATWVEVGNGGANSICADIASAGDNGGFTLEMFVKNDAASTNNVFWFDMSSGDGARRVQVQFPVDSSSSGCKTARAFSAFSSYNLGNNYSSVAAASDLRDAKWHHVALVYEQPDSSANGTMRLYLDYKASDRTFVVQRDNGGTGRLRLGETAGGWNGLYAALRLTSRALAPTEFLHVSDEVDGWREDKTIAFYPLDEMAAGYVFTAENTSGSQEAERSYWGTNYYNCAATTGYEASKAGNNVKLGVKHASGVAPVPEFYSTNDIPARYIYSGLRATTPLRELGASLATFGTAQTGNQGDWILFNWLTADLWDVANANGAYTLEFFAKFLSQSGNSAYWGFWDVGSTDDRVILQRSGNSSARLSCRSSSQTVAYQDIDSFVDGKWHHFAVVCDYSSNKARMYCDYTLVSEELTITKGANRTASNAVRLSEGNQWAQFSCFRATAAALSPEDFLYASDNYGGVLAFGADWNWNLDGTTGSTVTEASCAKAAVDDRQYAFKDGHAFIGSLSGIGSAVYAKPVIGGFRVLSGVKGDRNRSSAALSGNHLVSAVSGVLCDPGRVFTIEALAEVAVPASGNATLMGAENAVGETAWRLSVDTAGALYALFMNQAGALQVFKVMDGFAGAAHHVAIAADFPARMAKVYVDYTERLSLYAGDFAMPLAGDGTRFALGGGCDGSEISGMVDDVRCVHSILGIDALTRYRIEGFAIVFR